METMFDRALEGGMTRSEARREKRRAKRVRMTDQEKYEEWIRKHQNATGLVDILADIMVLPCGCQRTEEGDFRLFRTMTTEKWVHLQCRRPSPS